MTERMTSKELAELPVTVDILTAARCFGIGRTLAYQLAQAGEFPCAVLRAGAKYVVAKSALLQSLGVDQQVVSAA